MHVLTGTDYRRFSADAQSANWIALHLVAAFDRIDVRSSRGPFYLADCGLPASIRTRAALFLLHDFRSHPPSLERFLRGLNQPLRIF